MNGNSLLYRAYKSSFWTGVVLSLPFLVCAVWYAWSAFAGFDRYRRATKGPALDAELLQLSLHDELVRDLRRLTIPERPATSRLPTFEIVLTRDALDGLAGSAQKGAEGYVKGMLRKDGEVHEIRLRYRGGQHWHWVGTQKSLKIHLASGELLDGTRVFNLLNDVTPFGLEDQIILDLAREVGLVTPEYFPAWVRINNSDMGVYRYEAQPEEGLVRRMHRMPGSIYSGDTAAVRAETGAGALFWDRADWAKVAWADESQKEEFSELEGLLHAVTATSERDFATFAADHLDLDKYALFDALDVVFGGNDHDYFSNHKFYVDPNRGRFEPIAWSFRGFQHQPRLNLVDHPLLIRLKNTPAYLARRNAAVYALLTGKASEPEIRARAERAFAAAAPDLAADPYWDAYKLLPRVSRFYRFMVRPMSADQWALAADDELVGYARRVRFLLDRLERPGIRVDSFEEAPGVGGVRVLVDGDAAYALKEVTVHGVCQGDFSFYADDDRNGRLEVARDTLVARGRTGVGTTATRRTLLTAGVRLVARTDPQPKHGNVVADTEPRSYLYWLATPACAPSSVDLSFSNLTTGDSLRLTARLAGAPATCSPAPAEPPPNTAERVPTFAAGEASPHPWEYPPEAVPATIELGPGVVRIPVTRVFGPLETVRIRAGTQLLLGPDASLIFYGRTTVEGTSAAPVRVERLIPERPYGGLALQGPATAGSVLKQLRLRGGSTARGPSLAYTGTLNIHDTRDVLVDGAELDQCGPTEDEVHATYVTDLSLHDVTVRKPASDGIDLEFVTADLRGVTIVDAGDDCLDLMGTSLRLADSLLVGCVNNGIAAGEETTVAAHGLLIADAATGVLAKNASSVRLSRAVLLRDDKGLVTHHKETHYAGDSSIHGSELYAIDCNTVISRARGTTIEAGQIQLSVPATGVEHLRSQVLHIERWDDLEARVADLRLEGEQR